MRINSPDGGPDLIKWRVLRRYYEIQGCTQSHQGFYAKPGSHLSPDRQFSQVFLSPSGKAYAGRLELRASLDKHYDHRPVQPALPDVPISL